MENSLIPTLSDKLTCWTRYVDDTLVFVKRNESNAILRSLNSFHENIEFTSESEVNGKIAFLDVYLTRNALGGLETSVFRKPTNTDVYIHWKSFAAKSWKIGTLRTLTQREL